MTKPEDVLTVLVQAIEHAGYPAGPAGVAITMDPAANGFYAEGRYTVAGQSLTSTAMIG